MLLIWFPFDKYLKKVTPHLSTTEMILSEAFEYKQALVSDSISQHQWLLFALEHQLRFQVTFVLTERKKESCRMCDAIVNVIGSRTEDCVYVYIYLYKAGETGAIRTCFCCIRLYVSSPIILLIDNLLIFCWSMLLFYVMQPTNTLLQTLRLFTAQCCFVFKLFILSFHDILLRGNFYITHDLFKLH